MTSERKGLWHFIKHNIMILVALFAGLGCIVSAILFTSWLSRQVLRCPDWALYCDDSKVGM